MGIRREEYQSRNREKCDKIVNMGLSWLDTLGCEVAVHSDTTHSGVRD